MKYSRFISDENAISPDPFWLGRLISSVSVTDDVAIVDLMSIVNRRQLDRGWYSTGLQVEVPVQTIICDVRFCDRFECFT